MFHRDYVGPVGTPRAALMRVSADGVIRVSPGTSCADFSKPETGVALFSTYSMKDYGHLHNRKLGVQGEPPNGLLSTEIALEADKPVVVSYTRTWSTRGTAYTCQMHRTFVPEAGVHYQLQAEPLFSEGICSLAVTRLTEPARLVPASPARLCGA